MSRTKKKPKKQKLTPKQALFVKQYLIDMIGTQAAIRAGYSPNTAESQASTLLRNPKVSEALRDELKKRSERLDINADDVLRELIRIGMSDITNYLEFDIDGVGLYDSNKLTKDQTRAIAEVSETANALGVKQIKFKLHDKIKALDSIAKHLGMFINRHAGPDGGPIQIQDLGKLSDKELKIAEQLIRKTTLDDSTD